MKAPLFQISWASGVPSAVTVEGWAAAANNVKCKERTLQQYLAGRRSWEWTRPNPDTGNLDTLTITKRSHGTPGKRTSHDYLVTKDGETKRFTNLVDVAHYVERSVTTIKQYVYLYNGLVKRPTFTIERVATEPQAEPEKPKSGWLNYKRSRSVP